MTDALEGRQFGPGVPAVLHGDDVTTGADDTGELGDGGRTQCGRQVAYIMRRNRGVEGAFVRGEREAVGMHQANALVLQAAPRAFEQVGREVDADKVAADAAFGDFLQQPPGAAADFEERARLETGKFGNGRPDGLCLKTLVVEVADQVLVARGAAPGEVPLREEVPAVEVPSSGVRQPRYDNLPGRGLGRSSRRCRRYQGWSVG